MYKYNQVKHPHANSSIANYNNDLDKGSLQHRQRTSATALQKPFTVRYFCSNIKIDL